MADDGFPITPAEHDPNVIFIWFKGTSVTGRYVYDPRTKSTRLHTLVTESMQLQAERANLRREVGTGRIENALARARNYFAAQHQLS